MTVVLIRFTLVVSAAGVLLQRFLPKNGMLGHDYSHYFARLLVGADHFWKNGLAVPHFTPYLCGGIPFHADPQQIYYSLPQFLAFFWEVLPATYLSFGVFYFLGYWGMVRLCGDTFKLERRVCHFIALLFILNGFSFNHLFVGHITHMPFLLVPWFLAFGFQRRVIPFTLIVIYCIYSGALHVLVIFGLLFLLFFPLMLRRAGEEKATLSFLWFTALVPVLIAFTCSGKLAASYRYAPHFYMHHIDSSGRGFWNTLTTYLWFNPFNTPTRLPFGDWAYGAWEYTASLSRVTMILGLVGGFVALWNSKKHAVWVLLTLILGVGILLLAMGSSLNERLPFFSHYHNPLKILGVFILPVFILTGIALDRLAKEVPIHDWVFLALSFFVIGEFFISSEFLIRTPNALGFRYPGAEFSKVRSEGGLPPVSVLSNVKKDDYSSMRAGEVNLTCYEPLFGYRREMFRPRITSIRSGLTHPGCLLYSEDLGCEPWSLVSKEGSGFDSFARGVTVKEWVPHWQSMLNGVNSVCILLLVSLQSIALILPIKSSRPLLDSFLTQS